MIREEFKHLRRIERRRIPPTPQRVHRLHRLERPMPWPEPLRSQIINELSYQATVIQQYPDYAPFYTQLAEYTGFSEECIIVGDGIEGLIRDLMMVTCGPRDAMISLWPTCAMFDLYAQVFDVIPIWIDTTKELSEYALGDGLAARIKAAILRHKNYLKLVLLPNPGQPIETYLTPAQLEEIAVLCARREIVLAIDEAYFGFGAESSLPLVRSFSNVIVLRTFSKAFGAAALRVGFAVGCPDLIQVLHGARTSGEISGPSMAIASLLLREKQLVQEGVKHICRARDETVEHYGAMDAFGRRGNLVRLHVGPRAGEIVGELEKRAFRVRYAPMELPEHLIVTCGNELLMSCFRLELDSLLGFKPLKIVGETDGL